MLLKKYSFAFLLLMMFCLNFANAKLERCNAETPTSNDVDCSETEYTSYVECIRRRSKRHIDCNNSCDGGDCDGGDDCGECDCNYCSYNDCNDNCQSCCTNYQPPCATRTCCQATCHSTCRTSHCRRSCRTRCNKSVENKETIISTGSGGSSTDSKISNQAKHNITTVINLHNVVNNTNIVDMPVAINNTNYNNITLEAPEPGSINVQMHNTPGQQIPPQYPPQYPPQEPTSCCHLISPRQCVPTQEPPYSRCYHTRSRVCGQVCQASIMHAEPHRVCDQNTNLNDIQTQCHEQVAYIPQPQPRCFTTSQWPYVQCSVANANCAGCYKHLVNGGSSGSECSNACYEGGNNVGPYYSQGPVYQPNYYVPPVCGGNGCIGGMGGMGAMYGGMGGPVGQPPNTGYVESIGNTFDYRPRDLTPNNPDRSAGEDPFMKSKRHLDENEKSKADDDSSETLHFTVEELPITLSHS